MNCCEKTLVTLACVAGMSKEVQSADIDSVLRVIDAQGSMLSCAECAVTYDVLRGAVHFDASIKQAIEQISHEYVKTLGRCSDE